MITLRPLTLDDAGPVYLGWLNDPDVLRYRAPRQSAMTMDALREWIENIPERGDKVFAVCADGRHIGNIALNTIVDGSAELSIMIGAKDVWGRGYGSEAIRLITHYGFDTLGLDRLWAESPNPAFNAAVRKLGWKQEAPRRNEHFDLECWSKILVPNDLAHEDAICAVAVDDKAVVAVALRRIDG